MPKHILDNRQHRVADYLRQHLPEAEVLKLVSAYFSIYGYDLLKKELNKVKDVRFLFGDPASVGEVDPGEKAQKSFDLTEQGLSPTHQLEQKYIARECEKWVKSENVQIRSIKKSNFLHGKMYLTEAEKDEIAIVGSSNFTKNGMGGGIKSNLEINLATSDEDTHEELSEWFNSLWEDEDLIVDVKKKVLDALKRLGKNYAPEFVYYKTLFELFRDEIDARRENENELEDVHLYDTDIWKKLYDFQKDGAKSIIGRLLRLNGCILADSVGLGKTYTALAVIKFFELKYNAKVLVLCPKKLGNNWRVYSSHLNQKNNPFLRDEFNYHVLAHTDLSRDHGESFGILLENFNWSNFHLVVIDESHNFRNATEDRKNEKGEIIRRSRYNRLLEEVIKKGGKTKVLMLSATPVNTSLTDLRNQIYLMTEKNEEAFRDHLGIYNFRTLLNAAQKKFKEWEDSTERDKEALIEKLGGDFFNLLGGVSIARSRRQIKKFYSGLIKKIGDFPKHQPPENHEPPTDLRNELSYKDLHERISQFSLSIYRPSSYIKSEKIKEKLKEEKKRLHFNQEDREHYLVGMIRTNFLKRLESSAHSLHLTLERTVKKFDELMEKIERFEETKNFSDQIEVQPDQDDEDEEFVVSQKADSYHFGDLDIPAWKEELEKDRAILETCRQDVEKITPGRDGKLKKIKEDVRARVKNPTIDKDRKPNRKILVFTTFKDTAKYIYGELGNLAKELNLNMAMVSGDETHTTFGHNDFNEILTNFSPRSRGRNENSQEKNEIDLLIATDCISEGQNLQDCDMVLNYDIHWNPVRLIQRMGRIDRLGSRNNSVRMVNYWPTKDMDLYLRLQNRVEARMALADTAATGDEDRLNEDAYEKAQMELTFRDQQLRQLRKEIIDLDEVSDGVVISDFSMDYFLSQLLRYIEKNREELEAAPNGVYALTEASGNTVQQGVIFFLLHKSAGEEPLGNPIQPFYTVFIRDDGELRYNYIHAKQVLDLFDSLSEGKTEPLQDLCDDFDQKTQNGKEMGHYGMLLSESIKRIANTFQLYAEEKETEFLWPKTGEWPQENNDFELITWLIIRRK